MLCINTLALGLFTHSGFKTVKLEELLLITPPGKHQKVLPRALRADTHYNSYSLQRQRKPALFCWECFNLQLWLKLKINCICKWTIYTVESLLFVRGWYEQAKKFINKLIIMQISVSLGLGLLQEDKCFSTTTDFHRPDASPTAVKHRTHTKLWLGRTCASFLTLKQNFSMTLGNSAKISLCLNYSLFSRVE